MSNSSIDCIDAGSENCPCCLAATGDCLICSRLQGRKDCDCNWKGVCIYNEFLQGNRRVNNPRTEFFGKIIEKKYYLEDLVVFILEVEKGFALKASVPGSFLFLRSKDCDAHYDTPLCVMKADAEKGVIRVAVKIISAKTKTLLSAADGLMIRGVYRNGILGVSHLTGKEVKDQKILLIAKGMGLAPGILAADYLWRKNRVDWIIDPEKISEELVSDHLGEGEGIVRYLCLSREDDRQELCKLLLREQYDTVAVLASDYYLSLIGELVRETLPSAKLAQSNNFHICCGEGVCGSCSAADSHGNTFKMCKCQNKEKLPLTGPD